MCAQSPLKARALQRRHIKGTSQHYLIRTLPRPLVPLGAGLDAGVELGEIKRLWVQSGELVSSARQPAGADCWWQAVAAASEIPVVGLEVARVIRQAANEVAWVHRSVQMHQSSEQG